jgi:3-phosphoshikimate 1-carboxyvinyltransferase
LCAQPFASRLEGDAVTVAALIPQAARTLRQRGANIEGTLDPTRVGSIAPPILIEPAQLFEVTLDTVGTAGKIAALTSGVASGMDTTLAETLVSDPRLERLLVAMGAAIEAAGPALALYGGPLRGFVDAPPGCISGALSLFAAALGVADSVVTVRDVAADPIIAALRSSGMRMLAEGRGERLGTPIVELSVRGDTPISGLCVGGETARGTRASLPIIAALACACRGVSTIEQVPDDPVHGDRRAATLDMLRAFGIDAAATSEGLAVRDASTRRACTLRSRDPAIVEAATVLALTADGPSRIGDAECVVGSFPRFVTSLRALGARIELMS